MKKFYFSILLLISNLSFAQQNFFGQVVFEKTFSNYISTPYSIAWIQDTFYVSAISTMYNWWYRFDKNMTFVDSSIQIKATSSSYAIGFKGLATDGKVLYAGYDGSQNIFFVNPFDMDTLGHITNKDNYNHHALTYDPVEKVLWSIEPKKNTYYPGYILKIDPTNGQTLTKLNIPSTTFYPYGIGIDNYNSNQKILWSTSNLASDGLHFYILNMSNGTIKKDLAIGNIYATKYNGFGLQIIQHPDYPGKVIAVICAQSSKSPENTKVLFIDITLKDSPDKITNFNASATNKQVNLTWTNPTKDLLDNSITVDSVQVFRDNKIIATLVGNITSYIDQNLPAGYYTYKVVPYYKGRGGISSDYKSVGVDLLLNETFETVAANSVPQGWIVKDGYNDAATWHVNGYYMSNHTNGGVNVLACKWHSTYPKDEWIFTTPLYLKANTTYILDFYTTTAETEWKPVYTYPEVMSIEIMKSTSDTSQKEVTLFDGYINSPNHWHHNYEVQVTHEGTYYLAFHAKSKKDMAYIYVDDIIMYEKSSAPTSNENILIPNSFVLYQNYPNPFNPTTNIKFEIPFIANVKLTIFNSLGQEVQTLISGEISKGVHNFTFDAKNLSSGVYYYKLDIYGIKNYSITKKMLLVK